MDQNLNKGKAVVLMSGGMDSCVTAAIASQDYEIAALHASSGNVRNVVSFSVFTQLQIILQSRSGSQ